MTLSLIVIDTHVVLHDERLYYPDIQNTLGQADLDPQDMWESNGPL